MWLSWKFLYLSPSTVLVIFGHASHILFSTKIRALGFNSCCFITNDRRQSKALQLRKLYVPYKMRPFFAFIRVWRGVFGIKLLVFCFPSPLSLLEVWEWIVFLRILSSIRDRYPTNPILSSIFGRSKYVARLVRVRLGLIRMQKYGFEPNWKNKRTLNLKSRLNLKR